MISIVITSFKEPKTIGKAIDAALNQRTNLNYQIIVCAPDKETLDVAREYSKKYNRVKVFKDPGKGKSHALNMLFKKFKEGILILTDGDVILNEEVVQEFSNMFKDPQMGCVCGRPVPVENRMEMYGYWAHFLFDAAHIWRKEAYIKNKFIECSGYLFGFRILWPLKIPLDVAEDTIIPYFYWHRGYKIGYAEKAKVYVKNANNLKDWVKQKKRTSKAHETLEKYVDTSKTPRVKTLSNEAKGLIQMLNYPSSLKEGFWTLGLIFARLYMWISVMFETKIERKHYSDAWERVDSTK